MLRNQIQQKTGLTRKAIEYYEEKGLIEPHKTENGYRDYSEEELQKLLKISLYRKLGLTVAEMKEILSSDTKALATNLRKKQHQLATDKRKTNLLDALIHGLDDQVIYEELATIEREENLYTRLERTFPGYFGQLLFSAYQPFLNEPLKKGGETAYNDYVNYLDSLPAFTLSKEEEEYINNVSSSIDLNMLKEVNLKKIQAIQDSENWLKDNAALVQEYEAFKSSDDYLTSPMKTIQDKLKKYMLDNHYYDTAIPLIRKFSKSYDEYYTQLIEANDYFMKHSHP